MAFVDRRQALEAERVQGNVGLAVDETGDSRDQLEDRRRATGDFLGGFSNFFGAFWALRGKGHENNEQVRNRTYRQIVADCGRGSGAKVGGLRGERRARYIFFLWPVTLGGEICGAGARGPQSVPCTLL